MVISVINVDYNNWNKYYAEILDDFNFSQEDDEKSARILDGLVKQKSTKEFDAKKAIIVGAGPSIEKHVQYIKDNLDLNDYLIISSDGATTYLLQTDIIPDIIVTDLDGNMDDIITANNKGSLLYVHAHGDNVDNIRRYVPMLKDIIPTTQSTPYGKLENYGGFTDGDRAIHIAVYKYKIKKIILAAMDFGKYTTKYSRPNIMNKIERADSFKEKKLMYAQKLTESLIKNNKDIEFINLIELI